MCFKYHPAFKKKTKKNKSFNSTAFKINSLTSKFKTKQISDSIFNGKQTLINTIKKNVSKQWSKRFYNSQENKLRSLNTYHSHDGLEKRKCLNLRKANKQAKFEGNSEPNFLPYAELALEINKIDIVN